MAFSGSTFRGDLNSYVLEAIDADKMLIGLKVAPAAPVNIKLGQYPKFTTAASLLQSDVSQERASGSSYARVTRKFDQGTFSCVEYGLEELVDDSYKAEFARFFDAEVIAAWDAWDDDATYEGDRGATRLEAAIAALRGVLRG